MKYFIDTEFLEGTQKETFLGIPAVGLRWNKKLHEFLTQI